MPELKCAELIAGIVYIPSPTRISHGEADSLIQGLFFTYAARTPGTASATNPTVCLLDDAPQPDNLLRVRTSHGGATWVAADSDLLHGPPELVAEVSLSSTSYDLHQKKELYQSAGVPEYLVVLPSQDEVRWHVLVGKKYQTLQVEPEGRIRSRVFPGLWLDVAALLAGDGAALLATLERGLADPAHAAFVEHLAGQAS